MLVIAEVRRNIDINDIHEITKIDLFFLQKFKNIVDMTFKAALICWTGTAVESEKMGFTDNVIAMFTSSGKRT